MDSTGIPAVAIHHGRRQVLRRVLQVAGVQVSGLRLGHRRVFQGLHQPPIRHLGVIDRNEAIRHLRDRRATSTRCRRDGRQYCMDRLMECFAFDGGLAVCLYWRENVTTTNWFICI